MSKAIKRKIKLFWLPDYEKEERYLTDMHRSGWKLKKIRWICVYSFERCEPENVVYRLDFAGNKDMQSYVSMFREYGWEYIQEINDFSYFRKRADGIAKEDTEIFSDSESRLEMMRKIINTKLIPCWVIFLLGLIPNFIKALAHFFDDIPFHTGITVILALCFVWCSYGIIHCQIGFTKLKKKYKKEV